MITRQLVSINHQVNQINQSAGPKFMELHVASDDNFEDFFPRIPILLMTQYFI